MIDNIRFAILFLRVSDLRKIIQRKRMRKTFRRLFGPSSGITWVFHSADGEVCEACTLQANHYETCSCGHCPPRVTDVIHRPLSEVIRELEESWKT